MENMRVTEFLAVFVLLIKGVSSNCHPSEVNLPNHQTRCLKNCPENMYMFRQTCYSECPLNTNVTETELGRFCIAEHDAECQRPICPEDFPLCYRMNCLEKCPEYTVRFGNNCVIQCPSSHAFIVSTDCEGPCFAENTTCEKECPQSQPYVFKSFKSRHCLEYCPSYTNQEDENHTCRLKCPKDEPFLFNKTCLHNCPFSHPVVQIVTTAYNTMSQCSESCSVDTIVDGNFCVNACPIGKKDFNNTCVKECPTSHSLLFPNSISSASKARAKFTCVETCDVNSFYKLEYNSYCVDSCPPEFNYAFNDTCLKSCPLSNNFNILSNTGYKICVDSCPADTFISNETDCRIFCPDYENFMYNGSCYQECPSEAIFYPLNRYEPHFRCYRKCPGDTKIFNNTKCVDTCPLEAKYESNGTCVTQCEGYFHLSLIETDDYYYPVRHSYSCLAKCPVKYLIHQNNCVKECPTTSNYVFNNTCSETCPVERNFKQQEGGHYKCVKECLSNQLLHRETYCVSSCPDEAMYKINKTCVSICPNETRYKYSNFTTISVNWYDKKKVYHHYCLAECPPPTFYYQDTCVKECPKDKIFLFNRSCNMECPSDYYKFSTGNYYTCYEQCPSNTYVYNSSLCVLECPSDKNYESNGTCYQKCPQFSEFVHRVRSHFKCMNECDPMVTFNKTCLQHCPEEAQFQDEGKCIQHCEDGKRVYTFRNYTEVTQEKKIYDDFCLEACPAKTFYLNYTCISQCPHDTLELDNKCVKFCPKEQPLNYTTNSGKHICIYSCPYQTFRFRENCFDQCPTGLKSHHGSCTLECPKSHPYTHIVSQKCLRSCENNFVITDNNICDKKCPSGKHYIERNKCVKSCTNLNSLLQTTEQGLVCHDQCPHHLLLMENKGACVKNCPDSKLIVGSICRELYKCPNHLYIEHTDFGKRCTNKCSSGFYLDGTHCVKDCPPEMVVYDYICANECPFSHSLKYKTFDSSKPRVICYRQCPDGFVANGTDCIDESSCHSAKHYTYDHVCYETCPAFSAIDKSGYFTCVSLGSYLGAAIGLYIAIGMFTALLYFLTCYTGKKPNTSEKQNPEGIKTHFQLISKSKKNNENKKYVIRFLKKDNEEAEIIEVDNNKTVEKNDEENLQVEDDKSATTRRRVI